MTIEEAIRVFQYGAWWHDYADYRPETKKSDEYKDELLDAIDVATSALRAQQEAENEPLTLKELREMDGQPVYVTPQSGRGYVADAAGWAKVNARNERCEAPNLNFYFCEYVTYWLAYRHPPKGGGE